MRTIIAAAAAVFALSNLASAQSNPTTIVNVKGKTYAEISGCLAAAPNLLKEGTDFRRSDGGTDPNSFTWRIASPRGPNDSVLGNKITACEQKKS